MAEKSRSQDEQRYQAAILSSFVLLAIIKLYNYEEGGTITVTSTPCANNFTGKTVDNEIETRIKA